MIFMTRYTISNDANDRFEINDMMHEWFFEDMINCSRLFLLLLEL